MKADELKQEMDSVVEFIENPPRGWWEMPDVYLQVGEQKYRLKDVVLHNASRTLLLRAEAAE